MYQQIYRKNQNHYFQTQFVQKIFFLPENKDSQSREEYHSRCQKMNMIL